MTLKEILFVTFRRTTRLFSGHALRDRFPLLNAAYRAIGRTLSPPTAQVHGQTMYLDPGDSMGLAIQGTYEPEETEAVLRSVKSGMVVVDIGANIGYYTLLFARLVGPQGRVIAFEPDPATFALLKKNVDSNQHRNVELH